MGLVNNNQIFFNFMYIKNSVGDDLINMIVKEFLPKYGVEKSEIEKISSIRVGLKKIEINLEGNRLIEAHFDSKLGLQDPIEYTMKKRVLTASDQESSKATESSEKKKSKKVKINDEDWESIRQKCVTNQVPWKLGLKTLIEDKGFIVVAQRTNDFYYFFLLNPAIRKVQKVQVIIPMNAVKKIFANSSDNDIAKALICRASMKLEHEALKDYVEIPVMIKNETVAKNDETTSETSVVNEETTSEPNAETSESPQSEQTSEPTPEAETSQETQEPQPESESVSTESETNSEKVDEGSLGAEASPATEE